VKESFCRMRPDGMAVLPPVGNTAGIFCILEHKRMSDVCDRFFIRAKSTAENQYASLRSVISTVIQRQSWKIEQISFITGARSVDKQDLSKNLKFFRVPEKVGGLLRCPTDPLCCHLPHLHHRHPS